MSKVTDFKLHRPADRSDPGFTIPGHKIRWVSGKVTEINPGRYWAVVRKADLPPKLVEHIENFNPSAFAQGETIRRGDLVLAYASNELADKMRKEARLKAKEQEMLVRRPPVIGRDGVERVSVIENETQDVSRQMIEKFKKPRSED